MRHFWIIAAAAVVAWTCPTPADEPDAPAPAEADAPAEAEADLLEELDLNIRVQNIQYSSSLQFPPDGGDPVEHHRASLNLQIEHDRANPLHIAGVELEGRTNLGDAVTLTAPQFHARHHVHPIMHHGGRAGRTSRSLAINFEHPDPLARSLSITGHVLIRHPHVGHEAVIEPAGELEDKRLRIEGLDKPLTIRFERDDQHQQLKLIYDIQDEVDPIAGVRVYDADERPLQAHTAGSSRSNTRVERRFQVAVPDDGTLVLDLITEIQELRLPVDLKGLPLPRVTPDGEPEFTIRARPRRAPEEEQPDAGARRGGNLAPPELPGGPVPRPDIVIREPVRPAAPAEPARPADDPDAEPEPFDVVVEARPPSRRLPARNVVIDE